MLTPVLHQPVPDTPAAGKFDADRLMSVIAAFGDSAGTNKRIVAYEEAKRANEESLKALIEEAARLNAELAAREAEAKGRIDAANKALDERMAEARQLEIRLADRDVALNRRETALGDRERALDEREIKARNTGDDLARREESLAALELAAIGRDRESLARETDTKAKLEEAGKLNAEYVDKLARLRAIVTPAG